MSIGHVLGKGEGAGVVLCSTWCPVGSEFDASCWVDVHACSEWAHWLSDRPGSDHREGSLLLGMLPVASGIEVCIDRVIAVSVGVRRLGRKSMCVGLLS